MERKTLQLGLQISISISGRSEVIRQIQLSTIVINTIARNCRNWREWLSLRYEIVIRSTFAFSFSLFNTAVEFVHGRERNEITCWQIHRRTNGYGLETGQSTDRLEMQQQNAL